MPKAKKLPSGSWRVQASCNGERRSFTAPTKKEAELLALEFQNGKKTAPTDTRTVGECIDDYIDSKRNVLSPSTIDGYERCKKNNLLSLCDIPLKKITPLIIQKHINVLSADKSPKTVRNAHGLLASALKVYASEIVLNTTLPAKQKKIKQLPTVEELLPVIIGSEIELPCLLALWCGLRMSEIRGLKKSDIKDGVMHVHSTVVTVDGEHVTKNSTKTYDSTRLIRLPEHLQSLITALPEEQEKITLLTGQAIYKRFTRLLEHHNIQHMTFHDLRHLNASTMLALGVPDKYAMERGGWSSPNIMKSVYQHTFADARQKFDDVINDYFQKAISHENAHEKI